NDFYQKQNSWDIPETVIAIIKRKFEMERNNSMLGTSKSETSGFFRGLIAFWFFAEDNSKKGKEEKLKEACDKIKSICLFFGNNINDAQNIFEKFVLLLSIRFQNSIELLANHQKGIKRFAYFIVNLLFVKIADSSSINHLKQNKVHFLIKLF